jgi:MYXO-CTERM domain-containing protein
MSTRIVARFRSFPFVLAALGAALSSAARAGEPVVVEGRVVLRVADGLDGTSRRGLVLEHGETSTAIEVGPGVVIDRGATVRARGERDDRGVVHVEHVEVLRPAPGANRDIDPEFFAPRRVAFVLLSFEGEGPNPLSPEEAESRLLTGSSSTNNFYQQNSYGQEKITGRVFGPYVIPKPASCGDLADPLGLDKISLEARRAVKEEYPTAESEFLQFMYYFPQWSSCQWAGLAEVGTPEQPERDTWYNQASGCVVLAQELGHNYGMAHSHSYECVGGPYSDDCEFSEYGHPYDPMGHACGHMNVVQKAYMGWVENCNQVTATADGVFNLVPTELPCAGTQSLRFATGNTTPDGDPLYYDLEYRRPLGQFDGPGGDFGGGLAGVVVHVATDPWANSTMFMGEEWIYGPTTYILDMPGSAVMMHAGEEYTDHDGVVTFRVLEENPGHAVIEVEFPGGGAGAPECLDGSAPEIDQGRHGSLECAAEPIGPDVTAPTVAIVEPGDGETFATGAAFDIVAQGEDERGIADMLLYVNGQPQFKLFGEPWMWPVQDIPAGTYELGVVASDGPNWAPSAVVTITVSDDADTGEGGETGESGDGDGDGDGGTGSEGAAEEPSADGSGCGCAVPSSRRAGAGAFLLVLAALGVGRRRRCRDLL